MNWAVMDDNGIIHTGTEEEMRTAMDIMRAESAYEYAKQTHIGLHTTKELWDKYDTSWIGDLLLIQIHDRHR